MSFHVHIEEDWARYGIRAFVYERRGDGTVLVYQPDGKSVGVPEAATLSDDVRSAAAWQFPKDAAHALLAALSRHLGAVEHPEQLRADYDAERKRVDQFIAFLTEKPL